MKVYSKVSVNSLQQPVHGKPFATAAQKYHGKKNSEKTSAKYEWMTGRPKGGQLLGQVSNILKVCITAGRNNSGREVTHTPVGLQKQVLSFEDCIFAVVNVCRMLGRVRHSWALTWPRIGNVRKHACTCTKEIGNNSARGEIRVGYAENVASSSCVRTTAVPTEWMH